MRSGGKKTTSSFSLAFCQVWTTVLSRRVSSCSLRQTRWQHTRFIFGECLFACLLCTHTLLEPINRLRITVGESLISKLWSIVSSFMAVVLSTFGVGGHVGQVLGWYVSKQIDKEQFALLFNLAVLSKAGGIFADEKAYEVAAVFGHSGPSAQVKLWLEKR